MNREKRNMIVSLIISSLFIFLGIFTFNGSGYIYVILKIGAAAGVINIVIMSVVLYLQSKKRGIY